jgi:hypothetical protein
MDDEWASYQYNLDIFVICTINNLIVIYLWFPRYSASRHMLGP